MQDLNPLHPRIKLNHQFAGDMTEWLQSDLLVLSHNKIEKLQDSYFKKVLSKEDAEILIHMTMTKNHDAKYEGKFHFVLDGEEYHYHNDVPFVEPLDVVSHAFKHLKEQLADA